MNAITSVPARQAQPYADAASEALRNAIATATAELRPAILAYRTAHAALTASCDLLDTMRAAGSLVLAAAAIEAAAKHAEATARAALAQAMDEVGCPAVALTSHVVHLGTKQARVDIEDEGAIPAEMMRVPAPTPDKIAIGKLLRGGVEVPGARLIGNHEPQCVFRSR